LSVELFTSGDVAIAHTQLSISGSFPIPAKLVKHL